MGVDYSAHRGFGVRVERREDVGYFEDWLDDKLEGFDDLYYFSVGSENYGGDKNIIFVCIEVEDEIDKQNGFSFLDAKSEYLTEALKSLGLEYVGVPNIVGGLEVW